MPAITVPASFPFMPELGEPVRVYRPHAVTRVVGLLTSLILLIPAGMLGLVAYYYGRGAEVQAGIHILLWAFAISLLCAGLYVGRRTLFHWNEAAVVYANGFAYHVNRTLQSFRWSEIAKLTTRVVHYSYHGVVPLGSSYDCRICDGQGRQVRLNDSLPGVDDLIDRIREAVVPGQMERARKALAAGESLRFGPLSLHATQGIRLRKQDYGWDVVQAVAVENGRIVMIVEPRSRQISVPVAQAPNAEVFVTLVLDQLAARVASEERAAHGEDADADGSERVWLSEPTAAEQQQARRQVDLLQTGLMLENRFRRGVSTFYWIAGLGALNTVVGLVAGYALVFGLGFSYPINALAISVWQAMHGEGLDLIIAAAVLLELCVAGFFAACGILARRRLRWAFMAGMTVYALDGLIMLYYGALYGLGVHIGGLVMLYYGLQALRRQEEVHRLLREE